MSESNLPMELRMNILNFTPVEDSEKAMVSMDVSAENILNEMFSLNLNPMEIIANERERKGKIEKLKGMPGGILYDAMRELPWTRVEYRDLPRFGDLVNITANVEDVADELSQLELGVEFRVKYDTANRNIISILFPDYEDSAYEEFVLMDELSNPGKYLSSLNTGRAHTRL